MAERGHLPLLSGVPEAEVVAVCDPIKARREAAEALGLPAFKDLKHYFRRGGAEVSLIAAPSSLHVDLTLECIEAGQHVIVEKPMSMSLEGCDQMIQAAREAKRVLSVFHNRRYDPDYLAVRRLVRSGKLGKIYSIDSRINVWGSGASFGVKDFRQRWRLEAQWGGGALYDWGSHLLDQVGQLITAAPRRAFAVMRTGIWAKDCDDFARALIEFDDDTSAMVEVNYLTRYPGPRWQIIAEKGTVTNDPVSWSRLKVFWGESNLEEHLSAGAGNPAVIFSSVAKAARGKGRLAVSPESCRRTMRLLDACLQSSREGRSVEF
jgi:predicted dehydrogenase